MYETGNKVVQMREADAGRFPKQEILRNLFEKAAGKKRKKYRAMKKPVKKYTAGRFKPIEQCVREATILGISYGVYVSRGLDKVVIE